MGVRKEEIIECLAPDQYVVQKIDPQEEQWRIGNSPEQGSLLLDVQKFIFKNNTLDFEIDIKSPIFDSIDNIIINGVKFVKEKNNDSN